MESIFVAIFDFFPHFSFSSFASLTDEGVGQKTDRPTNGSIEKDESHRSSRFERTRVPTDRHNDSGTDILSTGAAICQEFAIDDRQSSIRRSRKTKDHRKHKDIKHHFLSAFVLSVVRSFVLSFVHSLFKSFFRIFISRKLRSVEDAKRKALLSKKLDNILTLTKLDSFSMPTYFDPILNPTPIDFRSNRTKFDFIPHPNRIDSILILTPIYSTSNYSPFDSIEKYWEIEFHFRRRDSGVHSTPNVIRRTCAPFSHGRRKSESVTKEETPRREGNSAKSALITLGETSRFNQRKDFLTLDRNSSVPALISSRTALLCGHRAYSFIRFTEAPLTIGRAEWRHGRFEKFSPTSCHANRSNFERSRRRWKLALDVLAMRDNPRANVNTDTSQMIKEAEGVIDSSLASSSSSSSSPYSYSFKKCDNSTSSLGYFDNSTLIQRDDSSTIPKKGDECVFIHPNCESSKLNLRGRDNSSSIYKISAKSSPPSRIDTPLNHVASEINRFDDDDAGDAVTTESDAGSVRVGAPVIRVTATAKPIGAAAAADAADAAGFSPRLPLRFINSITPSSRRAASQLAATLSRNRADRRRRRVGIPAATARRLGVLLVMMATAVAVSAAEEVRFEDIHAVVGLHCFKCSSINGSDPNCDDPYQPAFSYYVSNCGTGRHGHVGLFPARYCVKISGKRLRDGIRVTIRDCIIKKFVNMCGLIDFGTERLEGCVMSCRYNGCNAANPTSSPQHLLVLTLLLFLLLLLFSTFRSS